MVIVDTKEIKKIVIPTLDYQSEAIIALKKILNEDFCNAIKTISERKGRIGGREMN